MVKYYFYGVATPYVYECIEIANRAGAEIAGFIHNRKELPCPNDLDPVFGLEDIADCDRSIPVIFPMITPGYRKIALIEAQGNGFLIQGSLIDPTSVIAKSFRHGEGLLVNAGCVIGAQSEFGIQVLVNRSVSIGHHVIAGDYVSFGPGCVITGNCKIGKGTFIGAGAIVLPGITVGDNCIIGAGSVIAKDVESRSVVIGNPGKTIKSDIQGYQNIGV